jgi:NAD(P)-dependent dehydrogenase (short-subunit alcohol dehydrogenase family)
VAKLLLLAVFLLQITAISTKTAPGAGHDCHVTEAIGGLKGSRARSAYSASKHAVIGLTRSAALDYAARGIRINAVCSGMVNTPMAGFVSTKYDPEIVRRMVAQEPIGRFGEPEEIAAAVVWLCSPAESFMRGHAMTVDGGLLSG